MIRKLEVNRPATAPRLGPRAGQAPAQGPTPLGTTPPALGLRPGPAWGPPALSRRGLGSSPALSPLLSQPRECPPSLC